MRIFERNGTFRRSRPLASNSMNDTDSPGYLGVSEVFVALEMQHLCTFVSLVTCVPEENYNSGVLQEQSSSAYSSSTDEG